MMLIKLSTKVPRGPGRPKGAPSIFQLNRWLAGLAACAVAAWAAGPLGAASSAGVAEVPRLQRPPDVSFRLEIQRSIDRGLEFLAASQNSNGWWSTPDHPAITALAVSSFLGHPAGRHRTNPPPAVTRGLAQILACAKPDGSIQRAGLANYNTAICMMALVATRDPAHDDLLRRGRAFLTQGQMSPGAPGSPASPFTGGIGYGDRYEHSDVNNTLIALEALYYTKHLAKDRPAGEKDLNWEAVIQFLQNCQNLPARNTQEWVSSDPKDRGGFVYYPGHSMAGGVTNAATGRVALRSYGSASYSGLLSYIYANLTPDDPRVAAVLEWLRANFTLEENPGMGPQGYYYYLQLMTKGLDIAGTDQLALKDGGKVDWRRQTALKLINLQQKDGSWVNAQARWWENDPNLVTTYVVLALERLCAGL
jgi:squalene-hopene/tetraprenyl-beta-curcumene cyclase